MPLQAFQNFVCHALVPILLPCWWAVSGSISIAAVAADYGKITCNVLEQNLFYHELVPILLHVHVPCWRANTTASRCFHSKSFGWLQFYFQIYMALLQPSQMIEKTSLKTSARVMPSLVNVVIPPGISRTVLNRGVQVGLSKLLQIKKMDLWGVDFT